MRIATWNVNSLKARMERVEEWLAEKKPDVLMMQETKLADEAAPTMPFSMAGYDLVHHGEGRWNGVAIASRIGVEGIVTNFGDGPVRHSPGAEAVAEALEAEASEATADEARMVSAVCGGIRVVSIYAPNGRALDTPMSTTWPSSPARPMYPNRSELRWRRCATGAWSTPTGSTTPSRASIRGGIIEPATSTRASACASTTCT